jgi:hypothetical protein
MRKNLQDRELKNNSISKSSTVIEMIMVLISKDFSSRHMMLLKSTKKLTRRKTEIIL